MPYKVVGKVVYKQVNDKWRVLKTETNHAKALAYFRALMINVMGKEKMSGGMMK